MMVGVGYPWNIVWNSEVNFHLNGEFKMQKNRIWALEKPHTIYYDGKLLLSIILFYTILLFNIYKAY